MASFLTPIRTGRSPVEFCTAKLISSSTSYCQQLIKYNRAQSKRVRVLHNLSSCIGIKSNLERNQNEKEEKYIEFDSTSDKQSLARFQHRATGAIMNCDGIKDRERAEIIWNACLEHGLPSPKLTTIYVRYLCDIDQINASKQILADYTNSDSSYSRMAIISACVKSNRPKRALSELIEARKLGYATIHAYTRVLRYLGGLNEGSMASRVISVALNDKNVLPDRALFDTAIRAIGRSGRLREAFALLAEMRKQNIKPSPLTFEGLIFTCSHVGNNEGVGKRALIILEAARSENCVNARVLGATASVVLKCHIWNDARVQNLINEMKLQVRKLGENGFNQLSLDLNKFEYKIYDIERLRAKGTAKRHWI